MIYKISNKNTRSYNKDGVDKPYVTADLIDATGQIYEKVGAFNNEFSGETWEGDLVKNDKGYWKLVTPKAVAGANFKAKQIEETMVRKEQSISRFQDNKELSIKIASTMNKAVELAIAEIKDVRTLNTLEADILKWRHWLWVHWDDAVNEYPPFE